MKRKILKMLTAFSFAAVLTTSFSAVGVANAKNEQSDEISCAAKSAYVLDFDTGTVVYAKNENEKLPIASMTKIMTASIILDDVKAGKLNLSDEITVSEKAAGMGGSQVFLDANSTHTIKNLLKAVVIASANDAAVALSEAASGSEEAFVKRMNDKAEKLGLSNTNFVNATGLPALNAYSSAKDVSYMLKNLLSHDEYFEFSKIWLEDYVHPDGRKTTMTNTNKLVKFYQGCDGGKTGYTTEALFCLSATAKRGDTRIIATVIGEQNGKQRFKDVSDLFNYSFKAFENEVVVRKGENIGKTVKVEKGKQAEVDVYADENVSVFKKRAGDDNVEIVYELSDSVKPRKTRRRRGKRQNCEERSRHKNRRTQSRGQRRQGKLLRRDTTYPFKLVKKTLYKPSSRVVKKVFY